MEDNEEKKVNILKLVKEGARPLRKRAPRATQSIEGSNNIQAGRDVNVKTEKVDARPHVHVKTADGTIDAKQKRRLLDLRDQLYALSAAIQNEGRSKATIMGALNKAMGVNSYHELKAERFASAQQYLLVWLGRLNSFPSAPRKSASWRTSRIRAIQTRCNQYGWQLWRKDYMRRTFGQDSTVDLSNDELDRLYRAVMGKR